MKSHARILGHPIHQMIVPIPMGLFLVGSVLDIVQRLNTEFVVLLLVALLVAFPLAFYAIGRWLETFAYHTRISPLIYAAALLITLLVTVLTVTVQAYRAAVADPVKALRYE